MEVRPREGLLLWGLESAPTCRLDLRFTLTGRTGINLSVPVTHFPKMADFVEELVKGLFTEELVWPQCACVNILPPPFRPVEFRCVNCESSPVLRVVLQTPASIRSRCWAFRHPLPLLSDSGG